MANTSNAYGEVLLKTQNIETMEALFRAFKLQEDWVYGTSTTSEFEPVKIRDEFVLSLDFEGHGRWDYVSNLKSFCICTKFELTDEDLKVLTDNSWSMYYDFIDEERGLYWCGASEIELVHTPKTPYKSTNVIKHSDTTCDRTAINLIKLGFYETLDDLIESEIIERYDLEDEEELEYAFNTIGNLEDFAICYNCSVDDLIKDSGNLAYLFQLKNELSC